MNTANPSRDSLLPTVLVCALLVALGGCSAADAAPEDVSQSELGVGAFAECELPGPARRALGAAMRVLRSRGVELSGEVIVAFDHSHGSSSLELIFGGSGAWAAGAAIGLPRPRVQALLDEVGSNAGLLAGVSIPIPFDGDWRSLSFYLEAFWGFDAGVASGGRWRMLWSSTPGEAGEAGFWGTLTLAHGAGLCRGGTIAYASDEEINIVQAAWNHLVAQDRGEAREPASYARGTRSGGTDIRCNRQAASENFDALEACVARDRGRGGRGCLFDDGVRYRNREGRPVQICGERSGGGYSCDRDRLLECLEWSGGEACFDDCLLISGI